ncbi:MAG: hypothetical protein AAF747_10495, partial [Planctomycetota bacterium]
MFDVALRSRITLCFATVAACSYAAVGQFAGFGPGTFREVSAPSNGVERFDIKDFNADGLGDLIFSGSFP